VKLLGTKSFDVIVSDIRMPEMDGLQLLRAVREHDSEVPVVLMTASPISRRPWRPSRSAPSNTW